MAADWKSQIENETKFAEKSGRSAENRRWSEKPSRLMRAVSLRGRWKQFAVNRPTDDSEKNVSRRVRRLRFSVQDFLQPTPKGSIDWDHRFTTFFSLSPLGIFSSIGSETSRVDVSNISEQDAADRANFIRRRRKRIKFSRKQQSVVLINTWTTFQNISRCFDGIDRRRLEGAWANAIGGKRGNTEENFKQKIKSISRREHLGPLDRRAKDEWTEEMVHFNGGCTSSLFSRFCFFWAPPALEQLILSIRLALTGSAKKLLSRVTSHRHLFASCHSKSFAFIHKMLMTSRVAHRHHCVYLIGRKWIDGCCSLSSATGWLLHFQLFITPHAGRITTFAHPPKVILHH